MASVHVLALVLLLLATSIVTAGGTQLSILQAGDFSISVSPVVVTVTQGSYGMTTVIVTSFVNFSSPVDLAVSGLPSGALAGFGTNPVTPPRGGSASSPLIISVGSSVPAASYALTVAGMNGTVSHFVTLTLKVLSAGPTPDFTVVVSPASVTIQKGGSASGTVTITSLNGFSSSVALTAAGIPGGLGISFATNPVTLTAGGSANSAVSLKASSATATGTYPITIIGRSGTLTHSTTLTVVIMPAVTPDFSITPSPPAIWVTQGSSGSATLIISSFNGFSSAVTFSLSWVGSPPAGLTYSIPNKVTPSPGGFTSVALGVSAGSTASVGGFTLRVTGTSGSLIHDVNLAVQVNPAPSDFTVTASPTLVSLAQGASSSSTVAVRSTGVFSSPVTLSTLNVPAGLSLVFAANPLTPPVGGAVSSALTMTASPSTPVGTHTLILVANSGQLAHTVSITVTIAQAVLLDFSVTHSSPSVSLSQGMSATDTVIVLSQNDFSSAVALSGSWLTSAPTGVTFTIPSPITPLPSSAATSTLTIMASNSATVGNFTLRVTATSGGLSHFADLGVEVTSPKCLVATATYGSELSAEVQLLRNFRDQMVLRTYAGSSFMAAFNTWYYSFSPTLAKYIGTHEFGKTVMKAALYPLIGILYLSSSVYSMLAFEPEFAALMSGIVASFLIGLTYLTLPLSGVFWLLRRRINGVVKRRYTRCLVGLFVLLIESFIFAEVFALAGMMMIVSAGIVLTVLVGATVPVAFRVVESAERVL